VRQREAWLRPPLFFSFLFSLVSEYAGSRDSPPFGIKLQAIARILEERGDPFFFPPSFTFPSFLCKRTHGEHQRVRKHWHAWRSSTKGSAVAIRSAP